MPLKIIRLLLAFKHRQESQLLKQKKRTPCIIDRFQTPYNLPTSNQIRMTK
jgi:hypothetical protein